MVISDSFRGGSPRGKDFALGKTFLLPLYHVRCEALIVSLLLTLTPGLSSSNSYLLDAAQLAIY